jgi:hypothetical protein
MIELSFFDHLKIRSVFTEHSKQNNKDLTPGWGGQLVPVEGGQIQGLFTNLERYRVWVGIATISESSITMKNLFTILTSGRFNLAL